MSLRVKLPFGVLFAMNAMFFWTWIRARNSYTGRKKPLPLEYPVGFVVTFSTPRHWLLCAHHGHLEIRRAASLMEFIPGTLNVGLNFAAMLEMVIMIRAIVIDPVLLMSMVLSAALGAWLGAGVVNRMPRSAVQFAMGMALLIAGCVFIATNFCTCCRAGAKP